MAIRNVLLPLVGEPSSAAIAAIDKCVAVVGHLGARVSAIAVEEELFVRPKVAISAEPGSTAAAEVIRTVSDGHGLLEAVHAAASRFGIRSERILSRLAASDIPATLAARARLRDISIFAVKPHDDRSEKIVEGLIFGSGRPVLLCPEEFASELTVAFDNVVIAWDYTAPAARAVADALPMLQAATNVSIITATDDNSSEKFGSALVSHLAEHGIKASFAAVKIDGSSVGKVFDAYVKANGVNLLVMGAYRHSRLNELVWGGATKTVIRRPPCWVMMSH